MPESEIPGGEKEKKVSRKKAFRKPDPSFLTAAGAGLFVLLMASLRWGLIRDIHDPAVPTGIVLSLTIIFLSSYSIGKKRVANLGFWRFLHSVGGLAGLALLWIHTGVLWPTGLYEQALAFFFYLTIGTGLIEFLIERAAPQGSSRVGLRVIYQRVPAKQIPAELAEIRERAEKLVEDCTRETQKTRLAEIYLEHFEWFFRESRFVFKHFTRSSAPALWLQRAFMQARAGLNAKELEYLQHLYSIGKFKLGMDAYFAHQKFLEGLRLVHLPSSVAVVVLMIWHILAVLVYLI